MEKDQSQLPSPQGETSKSPSPSTSTSFLDRINELLTRDKQPALSASAMATPDTSTSTTDALSVASTPSKPVPSPATATKAAHEISPTVQLPSSEIQVPVLASDPAAKPEDSSVTESSTPPPPASLNTPALSSSSSATSETVSVSATGRSEVLPTWSSSTKSPSFGSKPTGSYPYGSSIFATSTSTPSTSTIQSHTFGQPSVTAPTSPGAVAIAFSPPSGFTFAIPDPVTQGSSSSEAAPAALPAPPAGKKFASTPLPNSSLRLPSQIPPAPGPVASQPTITVTNAPPPAARLSTWLSPGTTTVPPRNIQTADCKASKLVKELQAQIQPLKQKTLLEGLLSHLTFPNLDSVKDDSRCHVCLEPFLTGTIPELPVKLPCGHICGSVCILKWLSPKSAPPREKQCPICRKSIYGNECASEWNALIDLEKKMLGMPGRLQAMMPAPGRTQNNPPSDAPAIALPIEADIPASWGRGLVIQDEVRHDEMQWRAWTHFLEELVRYVESADEWVRWYHRRRLVVPIINMITVSTFIEMKKKGSVWISRVIVEVPELYLPLHSLLDQIHLDYYLATPGEEHYRKTADYHARIEGRGRCLWSSSTVDPAMAQQFTIPYSSISIR